MLVYKLFQQKLKTLFGRFGNAMNKVILLSCFQHLLTLCKNYIIITLNLLPTAVEKKGFRVFYFQQLLNGI